VRARLGSCTNDSMVPGECAVISSSAHALRLGDGLRHESGSVMATCAGTINTRSSGDAWLDVHMKRYIPAAEETILGIVVETHAEAYAVDICAPTRATLPVLSFEGATKHNRPKLAVGSLVHARILSSNYAKEPILSCVDKVGHAGGLGVLVGGYTFQCSTHLSRKLLIHPAASLALEKLGETISFEIVVGLNGRVWINAATVADSIVIQSLLLGRFAN
jgi:exosome complex component RRP40